MAEDRTSLAMHAQLYYSNGEYDRCLECLNRLKRTSGDNQDIKLLHNIALTEHAKSGFKDPQHLRTVLAGIKKSVKERASKGDADKQNRGGEDEVSTAFAEQLDTSVLLYNLAALYFHHKQYSLAQSILEGLFSVIEPVDERIAVHLCFLFLDVLLHTHRGDIHTDKDRERFSQLVSPIFHFIEKPHIFNGALQPAASAHPVEGENKENGDSGKSPDMIQFRFRLALYKAKALLLQSNVKNGKKEVKNALEIYQKEIRPKPGDACPVPTSMLLPSPEHTIANNGALFLKANLELLRHNYRKSLKLLQSCTRTGLPLDEVMFLNNLGCVHNSLQRYRTSVKLFARALQAGSGHVDGDGSSKGGAMTSSVSCEVAHNCGLALLQAQRPAAAFKCLQQSVTLFHHRPTVWLRLAQCCIAHLVQKKKEERAGVENDLVRGAIGNGGHRRLLLPVSNQGRSSSSSNSSSSNNSNAASGAGAGGSAATSTPGQQGELSYGYAAKCLRNALFLLDQRRRPHQSVATKARSVGFGTRGGAAAGAGGGGGEGSESAPQQDLDEGVEEMRVHALLSLAFVRLELNDPAGGLNSALAALLCPRLTPALGVIAHSYAAEALCMLSRPGEALEHLDPILGPSSSSGDGGGGDGGGEEATGAGGAAAGADADSVGSAEGGKGRFNLWLGVEGMSRAVGVAPVCEGSAAEVETLQTVGGVSGPATGASQMMAGNARCALYVNLASVYAMQNELSKAMTSVRTALSLCPHSSDAQRMLLYLLLRQGDTEAAMRLLKQRRGPP